MSSVGRFDFADGGIYSGALHDGAAEGLGFYVGPDGRGEYSGSWRGGFEESGVYRWSGGESCYEGQWLHGRRHGLGVEQLEGWLYKGEWTQGFKGRYGLRQSTRTGAKYEGSWIVGKQDGYGVETYADGGTYEGQWLRGVRHGYGVRQSVSYDLALRYHQSNALPSTPLPSPDGSPINPHGHDPLLSTRDRRIEQGRAGGFVLVADLREKDLDKRGRTGLKGTLRLIRQRSTGDIEDPTRLGVRGAPAVGGSVRSTVSTGRGTGRSTSRGGSRDEDEEEEWGSFVSLVGDTRFREDIVESYWGEWKNDRRSGYGICQRSDGVKYEGEWLNNKKNGYGVTTLRDGTRLSGKYRRNVLLSSTSDVKPFLMRTGRLKEQVENAMKEAEHAARVALDRAQIAQTRTISARIKADEAHLEAGRAESMAEAARAQAQNNANAVFEPGSQIFMNCLREEDFLSSSGSAGVHPDTTKPIPPLHGHSMKPHIVASKFLSLFRPKRRSLQQMPANTLDFESPANHTTAKYYSATGSTSLPFRGHDLANKELVPQVSRMNTSTVSPGSSTDVGGGIRSRDREFVGHQRQGILSSEYTVNHEIFSRPETVTAVIAQKLGSVAAQPEVRAGALLPRSTEDVVNQSDVFRGFEGHPEVSSVTLPTFSRFRDHTGSSDSPQRHRAPPGRRRAHAQIALPSVSPIASTEDGVPVDSQHQFRRKSLPSIIKEPVFPSSTKPTPANQSATTSGRKPEVSVTSGLRPERQTIVIEDGVRKRVTPVYGARSPVRALAVGGRAGLPKLYSMEATTSGGHGRGSVPDLTEAALEGVEVPPREVVYALSQQRREELMKERMEANRRRGGQIILRLGDVKDWCARRKMLIILLAVNYALVSVFYNLLQQQEQEPHQS